LNFFHSEFLVFIGTALS